MRAGATIRAGGAKHKVPVRPGHFWIATDCV